MRGAQSAVGGYMMNTCGGMVTFFFVLFSVSYNDPNISFHLFRVSVEQ